MFRLGLPVACGLGLRNADLTSTSPSNVTRTQVCAADMSLDAGSIRSSYTHDVEYRKPRQNGRLTE
ncbi:hypothetical protein J6590_050283 [Homalodisca vitripennis]|nr:hypothetical protein J6590_050283 [Homalodisca vitripennis]